MGIREQYHLFALFSYDLWMRKQKKRYLIFDIQSLSKRSGLLHVMRLLVFFFLGGGGGIFNFFHVVLAEYYHFVFFQKNLKNLGSAINRS